MNSQNNKSADELDLSSKDNYHPHTIRHTSRRININLDHKKALDTTLISKPSTKPYVGKSPRLPVNTLPRQSPNALSSRSPPRTFPRSRRSSHSPQKNQDSSPIKSSYSSDIIINLNGLDSSPLKGIKSSPPTLSSTKFEKAPLFSPQTKRQKKDDDFEPEISRKDPALKGNSSIDSEHPWASIGPKTAQKPFDELNLSYSDDADADSPIIKKKPSKKPSSQRRVTYMTKDPYKPFGEANDSIEINTLSTTPTRVARTRKAISAYSTKLHNNTASTSYSGSFQLTRVQFGGLIETCSPSESSSQLELIITGSGWSVKAGGRLLPLFDLPLKKINKVQLCKETSEVYVSLGQNRNVPISQKVYDQFKFDSKHYDGNGYSEENKIPMAGLFFTLSKDSENRTRFNRVLYNWVQDILKSKLDILSLAKINDLKARYNIFIQKKGISIFEPVTPKSVTTASGKGGNCDTVVISPSPPSASKLAVALSPSKDENIEGAIEASRATDTVETASLSELDDSPCKRQAYKTLGGPSGITKKSHFFSASDREFTETSESPPSKRFKPTQPDVLSGSLNLEPNESPKFTPLISTNFYGVNNNGTRRSSHRLASLNNSGLRGIDPNQGIDSKDPKAFRSTNKRVEYNWTEQRLFFDDGKFMQVSKEDFERLNDDEFLNDTLLNFFLKLTIEKNSSRAQTHLFNTFFFEKLMQKNLSGKGGFFNVRKWTSKVDLFQKDFVFIPIVENLHWYVIIVHNLSSLLKNAVPIEKDKSIDHERKIRAASSGSSTATSGQTSSSDSHEKQSSAEMSNIISTAVSHVLSSQSSGKSSNNVSPPDNKLASSEPSALGANASTTVVKKSKPTKILAPTRHNVRDDELSFPTKAPLSSEEVKTTVPVEDMATFFVLDSLKLRHPGSTNALIKYFIDEAEDKKSVKISKDYFQIRNISVPQQTNSSDCGVYLIHFIERFMTDPNQFVKLMMLPPKSIKQEERQQLSKLWKQDQLFGKREILKRQLVNLIPPEKEQYQNHIETKLQLPINQLILNPPIIQSQKNNIETPENLSPPPTIPSQHGLDSVDGGALHALSKDKLFISNPFELNESNGLNINDIPATGASTIENKSDGHASGKAESQDKDEDQNQYHYQGKNEKEDTTLNEIESGDEYENESENGNEYEYKSLEREEEEENEVENENENENEYEVDDEDQDGVEGDDEDQDGIEVDDEDRSDIDVEDEDQDGVDVENNIVHNNQDQVEERGQDGDENTDATQIGSKDEKENKSKNRPFLGNEYKVVCYDMEDEESASKFDNDGNNEIDLKNSLHSSEGEETNGSGRSASFEICADSPNVTPVDYFSVDFNSGNDIQVVESGSEDEETETSLSQNISDKNIADSGHHGHITDTDDLVAIDPSNQVFLGFGIKTADIHKPSGQYKRSEPLFILDDSPPPSGTQSNILKSDLCLISEPRGSKIGGTNVDSGKSSGNKAQLHSEINFVSDSDNSVSELPLAETRYSSDLEDEVLPLRSSLEIVNHSRIVTQRNCDVSDEEGERVVDSDDSVTLKKFPSTSSSSITRITQPKQKSRR